MLSKTLTDLCQRLLVAASPSRALVPPEQVLRLSITGADLALISMALKEKGILDLGLATRAGPDAAAAMIRQAGTIGALLTRIVEQGEAHFRGGGA